MEIWKDGVIVQATPEEEARLMAKRARQEELASERKVEDALKRSALKKFVNMGLSREEVQALFGVKDGLG